MKLFCEATIFNNKHFKGYMCMIFEYVMIFNMFIISSFIVILTAGPVNRLLASSSLCSGAI